MSKSLRLEEALGRIFHYLIHEKSIMQYFHELRYVKKDKKAFIDLLARALLEARRDRDIGKLDAYIPSSEELMNNIHNAQDIEVEKLAGAMLIIAAGYDPACKKCREKREGS